MMGAYAGKGFRVQQLELAQHLLAATKGDLKAAVAVLKQAQKLQVTTRTYTPKNSEVVVRVDSVAKTYRVGKTTVEALKSVSLDVYKGEFVAITGTSGSGKSTLLQLIGGLDKVSSGSVVVQGQNLATLSDRKLAQFRNRTIGFVFQFFFLQPFLSLQTNIEVPAMFARTKRAVRGERSAALAETVGLADRLKHLPRELSGGQMQRAAIARAMQNKPSILLADEPTGNLDSKNARAIFELFQQVRDEQGTTVVVVTHDMELAALADRSVHMSDGLLV